MVAIMAVMTMPTILSAQEYPCVHSKGQKNATNAGNQCSWKKNVQSEEEQNLQRAQFDLGERDI